VERHRIEHPVAIQRGNVFVIEVTRALHAPPYVSKATGIPLAKIAPTDDRRKLSEFRG